MDSRTDVVIDGGESYNESEVGERRCYMSNTPRRMSYFHLQRYVYLLARIANGDAKQSSVSLISNYTAHLCECGRNVGDNFLHYGVVLGVTLTILSSTFELSFTI